MGWETGTKREFKFDPNSTENEGRWRLYGPSLIAKDSYFRRKSGTSGISYVMGKASGGPAKGKSVIQAVRFDKDKFSEAEASKWWSKNHGRENLVFSNEREKEAMNREARIADRLVRTAAWMATGYYKDLSARLSWIGHGSKEADRMTNDLLRMLSSPIEDEEMGSVITKVRGLKATLGSLQDAVTQQHVALTTLYDELRRRIGVRKL